MTALKDETETKSAEVDQTASDDVPVVVDVFERQLSVTQREKFGQTHRGLRSRHIQLMVIGGSIGTGLFVGIGSSLSQAGPASLFLAYIFWGFTFIWPTYLCVAEMIAYLPVRGGIFELATRYVDPAFGFAMGWNYFYAGAMLNCAEWAAVATVMQYWEPDVNPAVWVAMAIVVCLVLNIVAVRWYGESEFIFCSTKILLLIGLVFCTFITMVGGNPKHDAYGFRHWKHGDAFLPYYTTGTTGEFLGWWSVVRYAAFTVAGPDLIALAAGEIQNPRRIIPRTARLIFYRLVGFYVVGVFALGIICSPHDPRLIGALESDLAGSAASPWVIGIENLGISGLPGFINVLILLSGWSCGNAYLYGTSRTLYSLARDGVAPRFFLKCTKAGVPVYCVLAVALISCATFLCSSNSSVTVFYWFVDLTTCAFILTYTSMLVVFVFWYRALKAQGVDRKDRTQIPYYAPLAPYTAYVAIGVGSVVLFFIGFDCFVPWSTQGFVTSYFGVAFFTFVFCLWKILKRTHFVDPKHADIISGKKEVDEECEIWENGGIEEVERERLAKMNIVRRTWERIW